MSAPRHDFTEAQLAACVGKVRHRSRADAKRAAAKMRRKHAAPFAIYRCRHCGLLHVGEEIL